jgi:hypothetical protein
MKLHWPNTPHTMGRLRHLRQRQVSVAPCEGAAGVRDHHIAASRQDRIYELGSCFEQRPQADGAGRLELLSHCGELRPGQDLLLAEMVHPQSLIDQPSGQAST